MDEPLWTVGDLARFLGVPAQTIYVWRCRGYGPPGVRIGRHLRFRPSDVERWLAERADYVTGSRRTLESSGGNTSRRRARNG